MHIAIEQQNIAQLGCAFNADRVLIAEKYVLRSLPCQVDYLFVAVCCGLFRDWAALI
jgi:hypothetical protein